MFRDIKDILWAIVAIVAIILILWLLTSWKWPEWEWPEWWPWKHQQPPPSTSGRIEGTVTHSGNPIQLWEKATISANGNMVTVDWDNTSFWIDLPAGSYTLTCKLYSWNNLIGQIYYNVVITAGSTVRRDINFV